jgi:circadian clock protein KaiC
VKRLDTMLGGGYYRGASVLITGFPGPPRRRLSGAFAEARLQARRAHHVRQLRFRRLGGDPQPASVGIRWTAT